MRVVSSGAVWVTLLAGLLVGACSGDATEVADAGRDLGFWQDTGTPPTPDRGLPPTPDQGPPPPPDFGPPQDGPLPPDSTPADGAPDQTPSDTAPPLDTTVTDTQPTDAPPPADAGTYALTLRVYGQGTVTASSGGLSCDHTSDPCSADYATGTTVTLTATPAANYVFAHWSGACSGTNASAAVVVDANRTCDANFIGITGQAVPLVPPVSVEQHATESALIRVIVEQVQHTLTAPLPFDLHVPDTYTDATTTASGTLPVGTIVTTYLIHFDPVGTASASATATLIFPRQILGIGYSQATLNASDPVGTGITYPTTGRPFDLPGDELTLRANRTTLDLKVAASTGSDQLRVITRYGGPLPIITSSNVTVPATPPASLEAGQAESTTNMLLLAERQGVNLASALQVDITATGSYPPDTPAGSAVGAGTAVNSYLIHYDPVGTANATAMTTITFATRIRGLIVNQAQLTPSTTALGLTSAVVYPASSATEIGGSDTIYYAGDRRSLRVSLTAGGGIDQIRVVLE